VTGHGAVTDPAATGARIETLLADLGGSTDPAVADRTRELVRLLADLYGAGLGRVVALAREHTESGRLLDALGDDPLVGPLLLLHDLHPLTVDARVARCVGRVRTLAAMRGVTVSLDGQEHDSVRVRIAAVSHACTGAIPEVAAALERGIAAAAPEIRHVRIERVEAAREPALIQITRAASAPAAGGAAAGDR
jgi:hypothetical protein